MNHPLRIATIEDLVRIDALLSNSPGTLGLGARRSRIRTAISGGVVFVCDQGGTGMSGAVFGEEMAPPDVKIEHAGWYITRIFVDETRRGEQLGLDLYLSLCRHLRDVLSVTEVWNVSSPPEGETPHGQVTVEGPGGCGTAFEWRGATGDKWSLRKTVTAGL